MKNSRYISYIIWTLIFLIIYPLIFPKGYIFAIDQVIPPYPWMPAHLWDHIYWVWLISQIFWLLNIPIWVLEKFLIFITFFTSALWAFLLFKKNNRGYGLFFAILLSFMNPFLYSRFLDGQINIYLAYAFMPMLVYFFDNFYKNTNFRNSLYLWIWWLLMSLTTIHSIYFIILLILIYTWVHIYWNYSKQNIIKIIQWILIVWLFQAIWVIPFLYNNNTNESSVSKQISSFDVSHYSAFQNTQSSINVYKEHLSLKWYWWDYQHRFIQNDVIDKAWEKNSVIYLLWFLVLAWILYRIKSWLNKQDYTFFLIWLIWYILSLWLSNGNIFEWFNMFLYKHLPMYAGFREPQKWVMLLVISYCYFWMYWLESIWKSLKALNIQKYVITFSIILLSLTPLYYSFNMLFGFSWQVSIQEYPKEWESIRNTLISWNQQQRYTTLVLPWHGYIGISWTGKKVGGWISQYFWDNILYGDTTEIWNVYSSSKRIESKIIEKYVSPVGLFKKEDISPQSLDDFIRDLNNIWIQNIILLKEADYKWYEDFLNIMLEKKLIEITKENNMIVLYKIINNF